MIDPKAYAAPEDLVEDGHSHSFYVHQVPPANREDWVPLYTGEQVEELTKQLEEANKERAWVRRKLKLPEDTGFLSGEKTLAGRMHNVCAHAHGYETYIVAHKCDDKQGEIARLTVRVLELEERLKQK